MSTTPSLDNITQRLQHIHIGDMATRPVSRQGQQASSSSGDTSSSATVEGHGVRAQFKVAAPDHFHGDRKKLREFISQVRMNFMFHPSAVDTEEKKVIYAATYLRGAAYDWFEPYMKDQLGPSSPKRPETIQMFQSFENFVVKIELVYGDVDTVKEAERDLQRLRQKGSTTDYASKFHQLSSRVQWDDAALAAVFYQGLKDSVKDELVRTDRPNELAPLIEIAIRIDNRLYERQLEKGNRNQPVFYQRYQSNTKRTRPRQQGYYPPGGSMPMDLDATKGKGYRKQKFQKSGRKLSESQRSERMKNNLCLYCGKPGHRARECKASRQQLNAIQGEPKGALRRRTPETTPHNTLSWTACYDDKCYIHMSDKDGAGWYPKKPKKFEKTKQSLNALLAERTDEPEGNAKAVLESQNPIDTLFTYNDDEPEYDADYDSEPPGPEEMRRYAEVLEVKKPDYVKLMTNLWTRVECFDPDCSQEAQHEHVTYDPEAVPKEQGKTFTIEFCKKSDCPDNGKSEFHAHQGSDKRETNAGITMNELDSGWETIEGPYQDNEDVGSNLEEEELSEISGCDEFCGCNDETDENHICTAGTVEVDMDETDQEILKMTHATISDYRTWREPYGHFPCKDKGCEYRKVYLSHEHFRNYTEKERIEAGIRTPSDIKKIRTPCNEKLGCLITGMHTHISDEEPKNL